MLRFFRRRNRRAQSTPAGSVADHNPELRIRNLLDDPALRRVMGLDDTSIPADDETRLPLTPAPRGPRFEPAAA